MNVSSGSTAAPAASAKGSDTAAQAPAPKNEGDTSFQEQLKAADNETQKPAEDEKTSEKQDDSIITQFALNGGVDFTDYKYNVHQELLSRNIQDLMNTQDMLRMDRFQGLDASLDYKNIKMSDNDALFFSDLVKNTDMSMQSVAQHMQNAMEANVEGVQQKAQVSATLMNLINEAAKNNQPVRIDFDKDVSVIIKVNKDGSISANFIPGDKAVEQYLRNNIPFLKQRFDEQELSYSELNYSRHKQQQEKRNNKEKNNE
jgi:hypothetical protein